MLKTVFRNLDLFLVFSSVLLAGTCLSLYAGSHDVRLLVVMFVLVVASQLVLFRRLTAEQKRQECLMDEMLERQKIDSKQIEAFISLYSTQQLSLPLPPMRGSAISPDFANIVVSEVYRKRPKVVVECGSGVSTIIAANCFRSLNAGHIVSVDHEEKYAEITRSNLRLHGLDAFATVVHAPLKEIIINSSKWLWYDTQFVDKLSKADMLIIDGPPRDPERKMVRYPALPLLSKYLNDDAIIILDDAGREDEKNVVEAWLKEFKGFRAEYFPTEKGTVIIQKVG